MLWRHVRNVAAGLVIFACGHAWGAESPVAAALRSDDAIALETALTRSWQTSSDEAGQQTLAILRGPQTWLRPVAVRVAAERAPAGALAQLAQQLDPARFHDERSLLVRAIGSVRSEEVPNLLEAFLADRDRVVQAAAINALADTGYVGVLDLILPRLSPQPPHRGGIDSFDTFVVDAAGYGAITDLTNLRPASLAEVRAFLRSSRPDARARAAAVDDRYCSQRDRNGRMVVGCFELSFQPPSAAGEFSAALAKQGLDDPRLLARELSRCVEDVDSTFSGVIGRIHCNVVSLNICNDQTMGMGGSRHGHQGFGGGNTITLNTTLFSQPTESWQAFFRHEFIHVAYAARYRDFPRWLTEGLACSYSRLESRSPWTPASVRSDCGGRTAALIDRGLFEQIDRWQSGLSSDRSGEAAYYSASHIAVDYLRFGVRSVPETRIAFLMGELSRGHTLASAASLVYGMDLPALDRSAAEWLQQSGAGAKTGR